MVIANAPFLYDGSPMPTRYWLVDARLPRRGEPPRVGGRRAPGRGRRRRRRRLADAHRRYAAERDALVPAGHAGPAPTRRGRRHAARREVPARPPGLVAGRWGRPGRRLGGGPARPVAGRADRRVNARPAVLGALDCGTNSTRLLVVGPDGEPLRPRGAHHAPRPGRRPDPGAAPRRHRPHGRPCWPTTRPRWRRLGVSRARLVATSAVRDAANRDEFLAAARRRGRRRGRGAERQRGGPAVLRRRDGRPRPRRGRRRRRRHRRRVDGAGRVGPAAGSRPCPLDLGCVRLTERDLPSDPPTAGRAGAATRAHRARALPGRVGAARARRRCPPGAACSGWPAPSSTLTALEQGLAHYDRDRLHHSVLTAAVVGRWCDTLAGRAGGGPAPAGRGWWTAARTSSSAGRSSCGR